MKESLGLKLRDGNCLQKTNQIMQIGLYPEVQNLYFFSIYNSKLKKSAKIISNVFILMKNI